MSIDKSKKKGKGFKSIFAKAKTKKKAELVIPEMEVVLETTDVEQNEETGEIQIIFKSEKGIGRGVNRLPFSRCAEYINLLEQWNETPPAEESRDSDLIAVAEATASVKDGILNHSWEFGKGKKPLRLKTEDIPALISHLKDYQGQVQAYLDGEELEDEDSYEDSHEDDLEDDLEDDDLEDDLEDDD